MTQLGAIIKIKRTGSNERILFLVKHPVTRVRLLVKTVKEIDYFCREQKLTYDRDGLMELLAQLNYHGIDGWSVSADMSDSFIEALQESI